MTSTWCCVRSDCNKTQLGFLEFTFTKADTEAQLDWMKNERQCEQNSPALEKQCFHKKNDKKT